MHKQIQQQQHNNKKPLKKKGGAFLTSKTPRKLLMQNLFLYLILFTSPLMVLLFTLLKGSYPYKK